MLSAKRNQRAQFARISELEATGTLKDNRIATLEEQISTTPTTELFEHQNQSHNEAIAQKNQESEVLRQELQRVWPEYQNFRNVHSGCDGRLHDLANQLRQAGNTNADLQLKNNTQATYLDRANQTVNELQSKVATLQQANATLGQKTLFSESHVEKYRVRPTWQANFDREMSVVGRKLRTSQGTVFKLRNRLQRAKTQASPLRERQLKVREDALKRQEDADDADVMDHDHVVGGSKAEEEDQQRRAIKSLEAKLCHAKKKKSRRRSAADEHFPTTAEQGEEGAQGGQARVEAVRRRI